MGSKAQRYLVFSISIVLAIIFSHQIILNLSLLKNTVSPERYLIRIALLLAAFFLPILGGWYSFRFVGGAIFSFFATVIVFFAGTVSASPLFVWFLLEYAGISYLVYRLLAYEENAIATIAVDREKYQNEKNDLEIAHKAKGEGISILFEKYSTYYNLRKLAGELSSSLSVAELSLMIVKHCQNFIGRGDLALLSLSESQGAPLTLAASQVFHPQAVWDPAAHRGPDLFDFWVLKNQRRLIVAETQQDFRFDIKETSRLNVRSLIIAPLLYERRVIGTLRIQSAVPEIFSNDDLRLIDTISILASSALSNAMLYERTEELAIKDSLTNLYVRRYFYDRLKDEHRRALISHRSLSLLMCDLDHFKDCNDRYGHGVGDLMLVEFAKILTLNLENSIIARYGGEEFAVLMPETTQENAILAAEKVRKIVEGTPFVIRRQRIEMTVSIGVGNMPLDALDLEMLVQKADEALYRAKREGRNKVCSSAS